MPAGHLYRYQAPSTLTGDGALALATSGGVSGTGPAAFPEFFSGVLTRPEDSAQALLAVARVARTRYFMPAASVGRDPIVTCDGEQLRFETFSSCCGVYARYDVLGGGLDGEMLGRGTTNVDVNSPLRDMLSRVHGGSPLHLRVGLDELTVTTDAGAVVERKVKLPERWLKGLVEVQIAAAGMDERARLSALEARRFLAALPAKGTARKPLWALPSGRALRLAASATPGAVCLPGTERLEALRALLPYAKGLAVYSAPVTAGNAAEASAWVLDLEDARFTLVLSADVTRGFSGEGKALLDVADSSRDDLDHRAEEAERVGRLLDWSPRVEVGELVDRSGLAVDEVRRALRVLGTAGRVGFDVTEASFFHRELPFDVGALLSLHPRAVAARELIATGAVRADADDASLFHVTGGSGRYLVRVSGDAGSCTCQWWHRHHGERGMCKHVLAAHLSVESPVEDDE
jgi:hypothetical protein